MDGAGIKEKANKNKDLAARKEKTPKNTQTTKNQQKRRESSRAGENDEKTTSKEPGTWHEFCSSSHVKLLSYCGCLLIG